MTYLFALYRLLITMSCITVPQKACGHYLCPNFTASVFTQPLKRAQSDFCPAWCLASAAVEADSSVFWVLTRHKGVWHRRFGTTYRSHLQESSLSRRCRRVAFPQMCTKRDLRTASPLKMGRVFSPETSISNHLKPRNNHNPEDERTELCRTGLQAHKTWNLALPWPLHDKRC